MSGTPYHNHREDLQTAQWLFYKVDAVIPAARMALDKEMQSATYRQPDWFR